MLRVSFKVCVQTPETRERDHLQILSQEKVSHPPPTQLVSAASALHRGEFVEYLKRPDHKQELVSQWQREFNSIPTHLRREDGMKAELHCKVDVRTTNTVEHLNTDTSQWIIVHQELLLGKETVEILRDLEKRVPL